MKTKGILLVIILSLAFMPKLCFGIEVVDAVICEKVEDLQPVNPANSFPSDIGKVWCWSQIKEGEGTAIKHIYYYNDEEKAAVELEINSPLFRTYSFKRILPAWTGLWRVDIVDADGNVLKSLEFVIHETTEEPEPEPSEEIEKSGSFGWPDTDSEEPTLMARR